MQTGVADVVAVAKAAAPVSYTHLMGYERVELMDTTDGSFMTPKEAERLMLRGSTLLLGIK